MPVGTFFLIIVLVIVALVAGFFLVGYFGDRSRGELREAKRDLTHSRQREKIAVKALRQIANGDGMPVLTAGDALNSIDNLYDKEISA